MAPAPGGTETLFYTSLLKLLVRVIQVIPQIVLVITATIDYFAKTEVMSLLLMKTQTDTFDQRSQSNLKASSYSVSFMVPRGARQAAKKDKKLMVLFSCNYYESK